jgi:uncharacterized protein with FMN-binding domain
MTIQTCFGWQRRTWLAMELLVVVMLLMTFAATASADTLESTTGALVEGKVVARDDKFVTMEVLVAGKPVQRKFPLSVVRALTVGGKREVLQGGGVAAPAAAGAVAVKRTPAEINALITKAAAPPDWLEATKLNLPASLDLSWPEKPPAPWNNQKNVGQFIWDVINPNTNRWREGVKLMHHLMDQHKGDKDVQTRAAGTLGSMYHHLFQDYARAAYWFRLAGTRQDHVALAECYWKLGSKEMAVGLLRGQRQIPLSAIKLWADMGDINEALRLSNLYVASAPDQAYLNAGDACRVAGRYQDALKYYQKVVALPDNPRNKRSKEWARSSVEAITLFETLDVKKVADGSYTASSLGYEAPVEIEVKVAGGKITDLKVTKHKEKQYYASLTETPAKIIQKQSVKGVDATSRATITSEAIIRATAKALKSGAK